MTHNLQNWEVFAKDPRTTVIPNDGVTEVGEPQTDQAWRVLRHELETFVCDGQYKLGLERILSTYLSNLSQGTQPAVWVSGFYGSGKSHLVRVLEYLWRDVTLPDGSSARSLVDLPADIQDLLRELTAAGKRSGGLWAAAGTLGASAGESVRLAVLGIIFKSAGLPERYQLGKFCLWLKQQGYFDAVKATVEAAGKNFYSELSHLYVSPVIASALLEVNPGFAADQRQAREFFRVQYPNVTDIGEDEMLSTMTDVLRLQSQGEGKLPCTLLILDELQQYIGENSDRPLQIQGIIQACSKRFGSQVLVIATGQSAIQGTVQLSKLKDRFMVRIELTDTDVEKVLRQVVLRKAPDKEPAVESALLEASGEIDRQLQGSRIAPSPVDRASLSADYPLLPTRRRFWEKALVAVDKAGSAGQLRTQLRIVHETLRSVADAPLGTVVPGDAIYEQLSADMLSGGVLPREIDQTIRELNDGTPDGALRSRLCALAFLVDQLPNDGIDATGLRPNAATFVDLLVKDLSGDGATLRGRVPQLLGELTETGTLMRTAEGDAPEYRMQTRESAEWDQAYRAARTRFQAAVVGFATKRTEVLRDAVKAELGRLAVTQGAHSKTARHTELSFASETPSVEQKLPLWVRDEWLVSEQTVRGDAAGAGEESPVVFIFLPKRKADDLKASLAGMKAAAEVLENRAHPTTPEGMTARNAMQNRFEGQQLQVKGIVAEIVANARVYQGGGTEVVLGSFKESVQSAVQSAATRLYRDFSDEDPKRWQTVIKRAREGSESPLAALSYQGDTKDHPVCSRVLAFVGNGRRGNEVRNHFTAPPFGWPKEAVEGSLLALLVADQLSAQFNGSPVTASSLDSGKLGQSDFRSVNVVISTVQRIGVRKLLTELGIAAKSNEEGVAAPQFVNALRELARRAGAEAPAPAAPNPSYLEDLSLQTGNELLMALYSDRERIGRDIAVWREDEKRIAARWGRWKMLERLLQYVDNVDNAEEIKGQAEAIRTQRRLLADPDPVPPLCNELSTQLREVFNGAYKRYQTAYYAAIKTLAETDVWQELPESEAATILAAHALREPKVPDVSTEEKLLAALSAHPLGSLETLVAALPTRVDAALTEANRFLEPKAVSLQFPKKTLKNAADADAYVSALKNEIMRHIDEGRPVIL